MSHIVVIETKIQDPAALTTACHRLGLAEPVHGKFRLFSEEAAGLSVNLPGWRFPIVLSTDEGLIKYDNYGGRWGDQRELEKLLQMYAVEKAKLEARRQGHTVLEQPLPDGSIKLTVQIAGAA